MPDARAFSFDRVAVVGGVKTPVTPPHTSCAVNLINETLGDLQVHSTDSDNTHYVVISAGYERPFTPQRFTFRHDEVAFWLTAAVSGTVVMIWG